MGIWLGRLGLGLAWLGLGIGLGLSWLHRLQPILVWISLPVLRLPGLWHQLW